MGFERAQKSVVLEGRWGSLHNECFIALGIRTGSDRVALTQGTAI